MSERKRAIADHMHEVHAETWPILSALSEEDRRLPVFGDGDSLWSISDLIGHLSDAEAGMLGQVRRLLAGEETVPEDFDLDRWNRSAVRRAKGRSYDDLLQSLLGAYQGALATLETAPESSLDLTGRHSSGDILSVEGYFRRIVDHRRDHTADIRRALATKPDHR